MGKSMKEDLGNFQYYCMPTKFQDLLDSLLEAHKLERSTLYLTFLEAPSVLALSCV